MIKNEDNNPIFPKNFNQLSDVQNANNQDLVNPKLVGLLGENLEDKSNVVWKNTLGLMSGYYRLAINQLYTNTFNAERVVTNESSAHGAE